MSAPNLYEDNKGKITLVNDVYFIDGYVLTNKDNAIENVDIDIPYNEIADKIVHNPNHYIIRLFDGDIVRYLHCMGYGNRNLFFGGITMTTSGSLYKNGLYWDANQCLFTRET